MKILITGARSYVAYYWALALKDKHEVIFADSMAMAYCRFSPFKAPFFKLAPPAQDFQGFRRDVLQIVLNESVDMIIPTCEEVFFLSAFKYELPCKVFCPDHQLLATLHNKFTVFQTLGFARAVKFPETHLVQKRSDVDRTFNSILKPVYSRFGAKIITDISLAEQANLDESIQWVQQRRLTGRSLCNYAIALEGRMLGHVCYHAKHRIKHSSALYLEPLENEAITDFTRAFIAKHNYTGQIAFDFIQTDEGQLTADLSHNFAQGDLGVHVIECNPRGTSGIHMMDLSTIAPALFEDGPFIKNHSEPVAFKFPLLMYRKLNLLENRVGVYFGAELKRARDVLKHPDHPMTAWATPAALLELLWRRVRRRIKLTEASTYDLEWNGDTLPQGAPQGSFSYWLESSTDHEVVYRYGVSGKALGLIHLDRRHGGFTVLEPAQGDDECAQGNELGQLLMQMP
jgi:hypothetical protein